MSSGTLWSIQWEIVFSLMLPIYLLLARRRTWLVSAIALVALIFGWRYELTAASYLPMFFFGSVLGLHWESVERRFQFLATRTLASHVWGVAFLITGLTGMCSVFLLGPVLRSHGIPLHQIVVPIVIAAIVLLLITVQVWPPVRRLLSSALPVALGKISFSLYLVQWPIIMLAIFLMPPGTVSIAITLAVSLGASVAFYFVIERPSHRLASYVGTRIRGSKTVADALVT
ncbi:hypothetical protein BH09ACT1_BH09ACT1_04800 [soil metagenome]